MVVLLNILVALYSSAYSDVTEDATDEYMALFAQKAIQFVRAPDENGTCHAQHPNSTQSPSWLGCIVDSHSLRFTIASPYPSSHRSSALPLTHPLTKPLFPQYSSRPLTSSNSSSSSSPSPGGSPHPTTHGSPIP